MQKATVLFPRLHQSVLAAIARTPEEISRGLSRRLFLYDEDGMLFVLPARDIARFTMVGMLFALDLVMIDCGRVTEIFERCLPGERSIVSSLPATEVLEVAAGWTSHFGLRTGDTVRVFLGASA